jgi:hypothetical protein
MIVHVDLRLVQGYNEMTIMKMSNTSGNNGAMMVATVCINVASYPTVDEEGEEMIQVVQSNVEAHVNVNKSNAAPSTLVDDGGANSTTGVVDANG